MKFSNCFPILLLLASHFVAAAPARWPTKKEMLEKEGELVYEGCTTLAVYCGAGLIAAKAFAKDPETIQNLNYATIIPATLGAIGQTGNFAIKYSKAEAIPQSLNIAAKAAWNSLKKTGNAALRAKSAVIGLGTGATKAGKKAVNIVKAVGTSVSNATKKGATLLKATGSRVVDPEAQVSIPLQNMPGTNAPRPPPSAHLASGLDNPAPATSVGSSANPSTANVSSGSDTSAEGSTPGGKSGRQRNKYKNKKKKAGASGSGSQPQNRNQGTASGSGPSSGPTVPQRGTSGRPASASGAGSHPQATSCNQKRMSPRNVNACAFKPGVKAPALKAAIANQNAAKSSSGKATKGQPAHSKKGSERKPLLKPKSHIQQKFGTQKQVSAQVKQASSQRKSTQQPQPVTKQKTTAPQQKDVQKQKSAGQKKGGPAAVKGSVAISNGKVKPH